MSGFEFKASVITYDDDGEIVTIGFADEAESPCNYLVIESSYEYDDQEKSLGLDKIYLELNDQSRSTYGGLKNITITPKNLVFNLDQKAQAKLKIDGDLSIEIEVPLRQEQAEKIQKVMLSEGVEVTF